MIALWQASVDSEDMRITSGDVANISMSSAASVSSSSSSAGLCEGDSSQNKLLGFNGPYDQQINFLRGIFGSNEGHLLLHPVLYIFLIISRFYKFNDVCF